MYLYVYAHELEFANKEDEAGPARANGYRWCTLRSAGRRYGPLAVHS